MSPETKAPIRERIARGFSAVEDVVYIGLGVLLTIGALVLLGSAAISVGRCLLAGSLYEDIVQLLDRILLILLVVELLYTVQVSFREHALVPEPFLLVGLIAAIRRVLVITAEFGQPGANAPEVIQFFLLELAVLTALIVSLAVSLMILGRRSARAVAHRAPPEGPQSSSIPEQGTNR